MRNIDIPLSKNVLSEKTSETNIIARGTSEKKGSLRFPKINLTKPKAKR